MKAVAVVQARMGSSRVPGKAMLPLAGKPLLWHLFDRAGRVPGIAECILATTADPRNAPMIAYAETLGHRWVAVEGEDDLAARIAKAVRLADADFVLKVGGDCPLIDVEVMTRMVETFRAAGDADFVSNRVLWSYPLGLSVDVVSRRSIEWCNGNLTSPEDRELFALFIRDHPDQFRVIPVVHDEDLSHHVWTVDEPADVPFMTELFATLYREGEVFFMRDVLAYLAARS